MHSRAWPGARFRFWGCGLREPRRAIGAVFFSGLYLACLVLWAGGLMNNWDLQAAHAQAGDCVWLLCTGDSFCSDGRRFEEDAVAHCKLRVCLAGESKAQENGDERRECKKA